MVICFRLDAEKRRFEEAKSRLSQKQTELGENERRVKRLQQYISNAEKEVAEQREQLKQLDQEVNRFRVLRHLPLKEQQIMLTWGVYQRVFIHIHLNDLIREHRLCSHKRISFSLRQ